MAIEYVKPYIHDVYEPNCSCLRLSVALDFAGSLASARYSLQSSEVRWDSYGPIRMQATVKYF